MACDRADGCYCGSNSDCDSDNCVLGTCMSNCAQKNGTLPEGCFCTSNGECASNICNVELNECDMNCNNGYGKYLDGC